MTDSPWIRLRKLMNILIQDSDLVGLDEKSIRLLEWIVEVYNPNEPLFVQRVIHQSGIASQATLHKCLSRLVASGMLQVEVDAADERRRRLSPTVRAMQTLQKLDQDVSSWFQKLEA